MSTVFIANEETSYIFQLIIPFTLYLYEHCHTIRSDDVTENVCRSCCIRIHCGHYQRIMGAICIKNINLFVIS